MELAKWGAAAVEWVHVCRVGGPGSVRCHTCVEGEWVSWMMV
jgi:hypothetical protein